MTGLSLALAALLAAAPDAGTRPDGGTHGRVFKDPVQITADKVEVLNKQNQAIWTGHVKALRGTTKISCARMIATYGAGQDVTRIECLGGVEMEDGDRWAKGDRGVFDTVKNVVELTGSPEAKQGPNAMKGTLVVFDLNKDTIDVQNPVAVFELAGHGPAKAKPPKKL